MFLPSPSALEKSHFDFAFYGLSVRNVANYSPPVFATDGPDECEILARLALVAGGHGASTDPEVIYDLMVGELVQQAVSLSGGPLEGADPDALLGAVAGRPPAERLIDVMVRSGPFGDHFGANPGGLSMSVLEANPHGVDLGALVPRLAEILRTPSGLIELDTPALVADVDRLAAALDEPPDERVRPRGPASPPFEQLVDAQHRGAGEGPSSLHPADEHRRCPWGRPGRRVDGGRELAGGSDHRAGRGDRRHAAGRGQPSPRLGS